MTPRTCADCGAPLARRYARFCDAHRWRHRGKPRRLLARMPEPAYQAFLREHYTGERGNVKALAERLGMPRWRVQRDAAVLGLTKPKEGRAWTDEEERFLLQHAGTRHVEWIARRLKRSRDSVISRMKRHGIRRALRDGYTMRDLEACFGLDHKRIAQWIERGWLEAERRESHANQTGDGRCPWVVQDAAILRFVEEHPMEFDLRKVDQRWFMDLITGGGAIRRALMLDEQMRAGEAA